MKMILPAFAAFMLLAQAARAEDASAYNIDIKNGAFTPATVEAPAGAKLKLVVRNQDDVPAEFESYKLNREQKIPAHDQTEVFVGPLDAGTYDFFDDNNPDAKGTLIVK